MNPIFKWRCTILLCLVTFANKEKLIILRKIN